MGSVDGPFSPVAFLLSYVVLQPTSIHTPSVSYILHYVYVQAIQSGTIAFVQQLRKRKCDDSSEAVLLLSGHQLTTEYLQKHGFSKPVLVECKDGLEIVVPASTFTVADVEKHVGKYHMKNLCIARLLHSNEPQ